MTLAFMIKELSSSLVHQEDLSNASFDCVPSEECFNLISNNLLIFRVFLIMVIRGYN